jgi:hypothetical protein
VEYAVGFVLALVVSFVARATGLDRDRAFYVAVVMAISSYYVLFAVLGGSTQALIVESIVMSAFVLVALIGFKLNLWLVAASLAGHGVFDGFHDLAYTNPGVPGWWPAFCGTFDVAAAGVLAWLLLQSKLAVR